MKKNEYGFGVIEMLIAVVMVVLIGAIGWLVYDKQNNKSEPEATSASTSASSVTTDQPEDESNQGYLVLKEWGVRFKLPNDLTDLQYKINDNRAAFYAKPVGANVTYRDNYQDLNEDGIAQYATEVLFRYDESTQSSAGASVDGKKIGNYYFYTYWSFSSLATGKGYSGIYNTSDCDQNDMSAKCQSFYESESKAFESVRKMLNTIEPAE